MSEWNTDLDKAPKDGTELLVRYTKQGNVSAIVNWNVVHNYWQSKGKYDAGLTFQSIVWMILPQYKGQNK